MAIFPPSWAPSWALSRVRAWGLLAVCISGCGWADTGSAGAPAIIDDRGTRVHVAAPPMRIVSLLPSLTESVCELGACARLVGTDRYSNHPPQVRGLPKTGGLDDANIEMILALKPDLVLLAQSARVIDRLESLGLKVVALEPRTHADVQRMLTVLAQLLDGAPQGRGASAASHFQQAATSAWRHIEAQVQAAAQTVPAKARGLTVYFEVDSAPYAASQSSFIGHTLAQLGAKNIVPGKMGPFPKLNPEYIVRANPQLIIIAQRQAGSLHTRPGWQQMAAVRQQRICTFDREQADVLTRPGPRMGEGARIIARCLQQAVSGA